MNRARQAAVVGMLMALLVALPAGAAGVAAGGTLPVVANIRSTCRLSTPGLSFGTLAPGDLRTAQSWVTIVCPAGVAYQITVDAGQHYDAATGLRRMFSENGDAIAYYFNKQDTPNSFPLPWGDAGYANTYPGGQPYAGVGTGVEQTALMYGDLDYRNNPQRTFAPGRYVDQLVMTIHY